MDSETFFKILPSLIYLISAIIVACLAASFAKKLENYKNDVLIKKKSEMISELLSIWISQPEERGRLNELTFEIFLWLPKDIAIELSKTLALQENSKNMREILSDIRVYLLGEKERIHPNWFVVFKNKKDN